MIIPLLYYYYTNKDYTTNGYTANIVYDIALLYCYTHSYWYRWYTTIIYIPIDLYNYYCYTNNDCIITNTILLVVKSITIITIL